MGECIEAIAYIETDFPEKFGIPRQSRLIEGLKGRIVFKPEYRSKEAFRGIEEYSHLWLLWHFSENHERPFTATVKPPRLGGNVRMGVFATRSPMHPNNIGLSCVKLDKYEWDEKYGPILYVTGIDMMDHTPIYDVKPYLPYVDSIPKARGGFGDRMKEKCLEVECEESLLNVYPEREHETIRALLAQDPRPGYQNDPNRAYGMSYQGHDIHFRVRENVLTVFEIVPLENVK